MRCNYCDYKVSDEAVYCPNCGEKVNTKKKNKTKEIDKTKIDEKEEKKASRLEITSTSGTAAGWGLLGFMFPLAGLILFAAWKDRYPENAKGAGIGALIRIIFRIILFFISFIIAFISNL